MIVVPIEIYGKRATPELAERWKQSIEAQWNGQTMEVAQKIFDTSLFSDDASEFWTFKDYLDQNTTNS